MKQNGIIKKKAGNRRLKHESYRESVWNSQRQRVKADLSHRR